MAALKDDVAGNRDGVVRAVVVVFVCMSFSLSVCLYVFMSVCLDNYMYVFMSVCISLCLPAYLSVCLSVCLPACLSLRLFVCIVLRFIVCDRNPPSCLPCISPLIFLSVNCVCENKNWQKSSIAEILFILHMGNSCIFRQFAYWHFFSQTLDIRHKKSLCK